MHTQPTNQQLMSFFKKPQNHDTSHLRIFAAKTREEIRIEKNVPQPIEQPKRRQTSGSDLWDGFWKKVKQGDSFVVTETFAQTVKASAGKRGIVLRSVSVGPFKVRVWKL